MKLKEYLAVGRPVVTTPFDELHRYEGLVNTATDAPGFAEAIRKAIGAPGAPDPGRNRVRPETWSAKADALLAELASAGLTPAA